MTRSRRFLITFMSVLLVIGALAAPMTAFAGGQTRVKSQTIQIAWDADKPVRVSVGKVRVVFQPGTLKEIDTEYTFTLTVATEGKKFYADLQLEPAHDGDFIQPVIAKFGNAEEVESDGQILQTVRGFLELDHFSRYSGWF